jgi:geranylgeranyl diphosphate synthase, type II
MQALVERYLAECSEITRKAILAALPVKEPRRYLYDLVTQQITSGGKGIRPALCIATCRSFGGSLEKALPSAVAIELLHNSFLIHDDVEDGSWFRRNRPTLYSEHGTAIAVNIGDAMYALSMRPLIENLNRVGPDVTLRVFREIEHMLLQSVEGQAMELGWIRDNVCDLTTDDYLRMTLKKTCWYTTIHPCRIGALVATGNSGDPVDLDRFNRFGYYLGAAFQIQDDALNLMNDRGGYGKENLGDIWEGKRTVMLIHLLNNATPDDLDRVRSFLRLPRSRRTERDVHWIAGRFSHYGSVDFAGAVARDLIQATISEFDVAYAGAPPSEHKDFIRSIIEYMIQREG